MSLYTEQETKTFEPLYTADDIEQKPNTTLGEYSITKSIASVANLNQEIPEQINYDLFVDEQWRKTVAENNLYDRQVVEDALLRNDAAVVQQGIATIQQRNDLFSQEAMQNMAIVRAKLKELASTAVERSVITNPQVLFNNVPEKVARTANTVTNKLSAAAALERINEDGNSWLSIGAGFLYEFTPFAAEQGAAIDRVAVKYGVPSNKIDRSTGRSETRARLQAVFRSLPEEQKGEWLTNLYTDLKDSVFITDWQAAYVAIQVAGTEEVEWGGIDDWLDRLGVVAAFASGIAAVLKSVNLFKAGNAIKNTHRAIAMAGGKDAIVASEAAKLANVASSRAQLQGAGAIVGELTGVSAVIDLTKLVTMNAAKILPDVVTTAATDLQKIVRQPVEKLIAELQDTMAVKGIRSEEATAELTRLQQVYSKANNPNIRSVDDFKLVDGTTIVSKVLYKPADSSSFLTKEAAEAYIASVDPANKLNMKVIPDTTNEGFLVEEKVKKNLELRRTELTVELAEAAKVTTVNEQAIKTGAAPSTSTISWTKIMSDAADSSDSSFLRVGNISLQEGTFQTKLLPFLEKMNKALGMEDRQITVMQMSTLLKSKNASLKKVAEYMLQKHPTASAVHFPVTNNKSVIIMKTDPIIKGDTKSVRRYIETFAHEYAHAFEAQFAMKYTGIMISSFNKWLMARKIGWTGKNQGIGRTIDALPFEAMLEYRNVTTAADVVKYVDDWFGGNKKAYLMHEKNLRGWTSLYSEFFAEQFSKWAFTDKVATDILGQTFQALVAGFKQIAMEVLQAVKEATNGAVDLTLEADKNIAAMLRQHVKLVKENKISSDYSMLNAASESKSTPRSADAIFKELEAVEEQLGAIKDAEEGLVTGWLVEMPINKTVTYNAIGKYESSDIDSAVRFSFGDWALSTSKELYADRVVGMQQGSRFQKLLINFVRPSLESLNKKDLNAVVDALVLGDKEGKVFSEVELAGLNMSTKGREAYYKIRALRDVMHQIRNDVAAKSLLRRGYLDIESPLDLAVPGKFFGKEVSVSENAIVFDGMANKTVVVNKAYLDSVERRGIVFYESIEPILIDGKYRKIFAFERSGIKTQVPKDVIPYRKGEFRRLYSDEYFVKITSNVEVDGVMKTITKTHRTAASMRDATKYVKAFKEAARLHKEGSLTLDKASALMEPYGWKPQNFIDELNDGRYGDDFNIDVKYNRTDDDYVNETIGISSNFSSARGDRVLSVHGEDTVNTLNPIDSIAAEISNTAFVASTNEWREAHVIRWFNTFKDDFMPNVQKMSPEDAFIYMLNNKGLYVGQSKQMAVAEKVQDYIISQLNIPSTEEKQYLGFMRMISEGIEGKSGSKSVEKIGAFLRSTKDYPTFMRTIAFNSFFAFNPVQFFMQGMNAFNAIAISPIHGMKAAKTSSFYALALFSDQPEIWSKVAKANKLTSFGLDISNDEFVEVVRAIRRSGLLDGMNTTSLYGAETGKFGMFNKWTRRLRTAAATPFNSGEGLSRIVSFDIARREWIAANPGKTWWLDDSMNAIMKRQDDLTQNMTKANVANWQKGWKSIPTQFVQYFVKLSMNVLQSISGNNRAFSRQEALMLFTMHAAVMGTSGMFLMPFRDILSDSLPDDLTEEQRLYIQQGVVAGMIGSITDGELKLGLGTRFNTFKYYEDLLKGILDPEKNFLEVLSGPSGFAAARILGGVYEGLEILVKAPMTLDTLQLAMTEIGKSSFSSINNVYKAKLAKENYNKVMSASGKPMYTITDSERFALAMGIPPAAQTDLSIRYESKKAHEDEIATAGKVVAEHAFLARQALKSSNDMGAYKTHMAIVQAHLNMYEGADLQALRRAMWKSPFFTQLQTLMLDQQTKGYELTDLTVRK